MAVAVKNASEAAPSSVLDRLAVSSLLGVLYVLGSIGIVFYAIPSLWSAGIAAAINQSFISTGLLIVAMAAAAGGLLFLGARLVGPQLPHGLRAGVGLGILGLLAIVTVTWCLGAALEDLTETWHFVGLGITLAVGLGLLYFAGRAFFHPKFEETLAAVEDQGWFSRTVYKGSQGQRVRRGTMIAILLLVGFGIATLSIHHTLDVVGYEVVENGQKIVVNDWMATVPFTADGGHWGLQVYPLRDVSFTLPALLTLAGLWVAFRIVNYPTFADFLIATEAEMNKVSWTTRKRLFQDTIVVLVTLVMLTVFLMVVDLMWGFILTRMNVLEKPTEGTQTQERVQPW